MNIIKDPILTAQARIDKSHYQTITKVDGHLIISDEPVEKGGQNSAANPQGLFLASIGSCTAITLRMYIDRKMWTVDEIVVDVDLFKVVDGTLIEMRIDFTGNLDDEQKKRLVQIANACPIHKMLTGNIRIETALK